LGDRDTFFPFIPATEQHEGPGTLPEGVNHESTTKVDPRIAGKPGADRNAGIIRACRESLGTPDPPALAVRRRVWALAAGYSTLRHMNENVGFIGTGVMGASMAKHLLAAGHPVRVFNRTREKARAVLEAGGVWCDTPARVADESDVVVTMVGTPRDVEEIYLGEDGIVTRAPRGALLIDMTTSDPLLAQRIADAARQRTIDVLDAPVSGGDIGARNATLSIMVGGEAAAFERAKPILGRLGKTIVHQGPPGAGQYTKLSNQVAIAATMLSVCESMVFAKAAGLDPSRVLQSITTGAANSWSLSELMPRALRGDFEPGFSVAHFTKDLQIAFDCAERLGLELPGLTLAKRLYDELARSGAATKGTQVLFRRYLERIES
jgi:3-hydroxyisobutyrate dehydrogenase